MIKEEGKAEAYHRYKNVKTEQSGDKDVLLDILSQIGSSYRFHTHSVTFCQWRIDLSSKTLKRAVNNGHMDVEKWLYVNEMKPIIDYSSVGYLATRCHIPTYNTQSWVIDFDDIRECSSPEEFRALCIKRGCREPELVTQTSKHCFHAAIFGLYGEWPDDKKDGWCAQFAGLDSIPSNRKEFSRKLRRAGIDTKYIAQNPYMSKIRVPGSINSSRPDEKDPNKAFVCKGSGWDNLKFFEPEPTVKYPVRQDAEQQKKSGKMNEFWKKFEIKIEAKLRGIKMSKRARKKLAAWLAYHLTHLKRGVCSISQNFISSVIGLSQPHVSKILKKMVNSGLLEIIDSDYIPCKKATIYGFGEVFMKFLFPEPSKGKRYDLTEEYKKGETNSRMLSDIAYMHRIGFSQESMVEIIMEKMLNRPRDNRRSETEIKRAVEIWFERARFTPAKIPYFDYLPILGSLKAERVFDG